MEKQCCGTSHCIFVTDIIEETERSPFYNHEGNILALLV
jgi:hypothetical protein